MTSYDEIYNRRLLAERDQAIAQRDKLWNALKFARETIEGWESDGMCMTQVNWVKEQIQAAMDKEKAG